MAFDWNDLRILLALERAGAITSAARALGVDHSTVSRRLVALEDSLGAKLVARTPDGLVWSDAGREALVAARQVEATALGLERRLAQADALEGPVRISVPSGLTSLVARAIAVLRDTHPTIRVEVAGANQQLDLRRREADVAVRMARPTQPDLTFRLAFHLGWGVYASADYLARRGTPATPADLGGHDLVLYSAALTGVVGPRWLEEHQAGGVVVMRADNAQVAAAAALAGVGVTVLPCFLEEDYRELRRVFPAPVGLAEGYLVFHEDLRGSGRVKVVVDFLGAFFEERRTLLTGQTDIRTTQDS